MHSTHYCHQVAALQALLKAGAEVNQVSGLGTTSLHTALRYQDWSCASILVRAGANVSCPDYLGDTPLSLALQHSNLQMANILLAAGAHPYMASSKRYRMPCQ